MNTANNDFGIIGLGKMGGNLALQALEKGYSVSGFDKKKPEDIYIEKGLAFHSELSEFVDSLKSARKIFLYVPAGPIVDTIIGELKNNLNSGDIIIDGGNTYWKDSIKRYQQLLKDEIGFVDLGTSGGLEGAYRGACFMAGGDHEIVNQVEPILKDLAVENGYVHAGPAGAGHFVKLVHNGIEFGMLQAIGEGVDLLKKYHNELQIDEILHCWRNGSVIRSWLVDLMHQAYQDKDGIEEVPSYVEDTGEVNWLVNDALNMEVSIPVIAQSVMQLINSRDDNKYWARAIAMMRHGFGGHPFGPDEAIAKERHEGKVTES